MGIISLETLFSIFLQKGLCFFFGAKIVCLNHVHSLVVMFVLFWLSNSILRAIIHLNLKFNPQFWYCLNYVTESIVTFYFEKKKRIHFPHSTRIIISFIMCDWILWCGLQQEKWSSSEKLLTYCPFNKLSVKPRALLNKIKETFSLLEVWTRTEFT